MLIRPGEAGRDGQMEGGGTDAERVLKKYRNRFEKRIDCSDYPKKKSNAKRGLQTIQEDHKNREIYVAFGFKGD